MRLLLAWSCFWLVSALYLRYFWRVHPLRSNGVERKDGGTHGFVDFIYKWPPALAGFALGALFLYGALAQ